MDSFIGASYFGYSLRQTGWPVTCLQCLHYGHYVQSSKFEGGYQPQNIIPVWLWLPPYPQALDKNDIPAGGKARK